MFAKFHCAALHIKKALGIFRELIPRTTGRTTRIAFWDLPSGSKNLLYIDSVYSSVNMSHVCILLLLLSVFV